MPIYVFIILFFIATFLGCEKKYFSELSYFMILAVLCILPLLVGINSDRADFNNYLLFFQESPTSIFSTEFYNYVEQQHAEIGYSYFQAIVKFFVNSATFFFIVFCFLSLFTRYKYYRYLMSLSDLAIAMFAFFSHEFLRKDCVQIRNGMASAIVLFALIFLFQNKKIKFLFFVLLASTFHVTALAALPLIFIQLNFSKRNVHFLLFIFLVSLCLSIFFPLKKLLIVSASFLPSRLSVYIDWADYLVAMPFIHPILLKQVFITVFIFLDIKNYLQTE
ncbi:EpsG family protein [Treponema phagedenis]|uniref:EpsG family protein n=1 Tax=Treponema phagedenis TaxID=162 RepID=UPI0011EEB78E|nr:EpsG family protein [Treponema phagedenis]TYT76513.1 EpsG family protein [Treponema phagedenis]